MFQGFLFDVYRSGFEALLGVELGKFGGKFDLAYLGRSQLSKSSCPCTPGKLEPLEPHMKTI